MDLFGRGLAACTVFGINPDTVISVRTITLERHHKVKDVGVAIECNDNTLNVLIGDFKKSYDKEYKYSAIHEMIEDGLKKSYIAQMFDMSLNVLDALQFSITTEKENKND